MKALTRYLNHMTETYLWTVVFLYVITILFLSPLHKILESATMILQNHIKDTQEDTSWLWLFFHGILATILLVGGCLASGLQYIQYTEKRRAQGNPPANSMFLITMTLFLGGTTTSILIQAYPESEIGQMLQASVFSATVIYAILWIGSLIYMAASILAAAQRHYRKLFQSRKR